MCLDKLQLMSFTFLFHNRYKDILLVLNMCCKLSIEKKKYVFKYTLIYNSLNSE